MKWLMTAAVLAGMSGALSAADFQDLQRLRASDIGVQTMAGEQINDQCSIPAAGETDPRHFTIDENSTVIEEIADKGGATGFNGTVKQLGGAIGVIGNIVNLGEKIWNVIEKNQPVVNATTKYANAVPYGISSWTQLQGWSRPAAKKYSFSQKNGFGCEVVKVVYQVQYTHSGNLDGKGKFLTGVSIEPLSIAVAWAYKVSLASEVPDPTIANVGTSTDPVASMQVQLRWTTHTVMKEMTCKAIYYVQGDGLLQELGTPFENAKEIKALITRPARRL
ncbi:MAG: hypothetical protein WCK76_10450 [Elusimicrobiota bacterium]